MKMPIATGGKFIKGSDFDAGLTLTIEKEPELIEASNPKYGYPDGPNQGKTVRYYFNDRIFDSKSSRFAGAISKFEVGDTIHIQRNSAGTDTTYSMSKADPKDVESVPDAFNKPVPDIPFGN